MTDYAYRSGFGYHFWTLILGIEIFIAICWTITQVVLHVYGHVPFIPVVPLFLAPVVTLTGIWAAVSEERRSGRPRWRLALGMPVWLTFSFVCAIWIVFTA